MLWVILCAHASLFATLESSSFSSVGLIDTLFHLTDTDIRPHTSQAAAERMQKMALYVNRNGAEFERMMMVKEQVI